MGTRANFFIGNPQDLAGRQWLGCVAYDGHPDGDCGETLRNVNSPEAFRDAVEKIKANRDDFTDPATHSFPFPWANNVFLTDVTYAWFDGAVQATIFRFGWRPLEAFFGEESVYPDDHQRELPGDVPSPSGSGPRGPDSIMILSVRETHD